MVETAVSEKIRGVLGIRSAMPINVLVECRQARSSRWTEEQWEAVAVVTGSDSGADELETTLVHEDGESRRYLWSGLDLVLYRDACESYWYNLMSGRPYLYVICEMIEGDDGDERLTPFLVTADQQEATGHMETDDRVYSVPMPEKVHRWAEQFVLENYVPAQKKKRRRQEWTEESDSDVKAAAHGPSRSARH